MKHETCNHESTAPGKSSNFHTRMFVQIVYVSQRSNNWIRKSSMTDIWGMVLSQERKCETGESRGKVGKGYPNQGSM